MSNIEEVQAQLRRVSSEVNDALQDAASAGRRLMDVESVIASTLADSQRPEAAALTANVAAAQDALGDAIQLLSSAHTAVLLLVIM